MLVVETRDIRRTYIMGEEPVHALRGASLSVERGDFLAVMGASGSGKSTFMNILGCLDRADSGTYILEGSEVSGLTADALAEIRNRRLGFVFQGFNLLPRTTALENVMLPMVYAGVSAKLRRELGMQALEQVGLASRAGHFSSQLSGGQQQRVAIARALVNDPAMILADEPTGNLDSRTTLEVMAIFQRLNTQGITIIMVTHEPEVAEFTKRNVTFRDGMIVGDAAVMQPRNAAALMDGAA